MTATSETPRLTEITMTFTPEELARMATALLMSRSTAEREARAGLGGNDGEDCRRAGVAFNDLLSRVDRARGRR